MGDEDAEMNQSHGQLSAEGFELLTDNQKGNSSFISIKFENGRCYVLKGRRTQYFGKMMIWSSVSINSVLSCEYASGAYQI